MNVKTTLKTWLWLAATAFATNLSAQNALDFDGTDDKVDCGNDTSIQIKGRYITLEAWIYPTAWKTNAYDGNVICKENNTNNYGYMLRVGNGGRLNFAIGDGKWQERTTGAILSLNTWQHIAGTYDGTKMRVYLNGSAVDSVSVSTSIAQATSPNLFVGAHSSYTRFYQGIVDEVRVWDVCRSTKEISSSMNNEFCARTKGLKLYYKFSQGKASGTNPAVKVVNDLSGYGNNGTLNFFTLSGGASNWVKGASLYKSVVNANDTLVRCDRFSSPSGKYKWFASGVYHDTIPTYMACDSAITFYLTIKKSTAKTIVAFACSSYKSPSGVYTWTKSGTYTDYLVNSVQCDSVITVKLTIGAGRDTIYPVACHSYVVPSGKRTLTADGVYLDTVTSYRGCDSVVQINLSLLKPVYGNIAPQACRSYTSPSGKYVYTQPGNYVDTILSSQSCDSIVNISLSFLSTSRTINRTMCKSFTSPSGKYVWTNSGVYKDTIPNEAGCDSLLTINLKINQPTTGSTSVTACRYYIYPRKKIKWTASGAYYDTLKNAAGCDSFLTINVTINNANPAVTQSGQTLTAVSSTGSYQWLNCTLLKAKIAGETNKTFVPNKNGDYALEITDNGCKDTSACYTVTGVSVKEIVPIIDFSIIPNPNKGTFYISAPSLNTQNTLRIRDISGRVVMEKTGSTTGLMVQLDARPGIYVVEIFANGQTGTQYLMVE